MYWETKLNNWKNGKYEKYDKKINYLYMWKTSAIEKDKKSVFKELYARNDFLPKSQNYTPFLDKLRASKNKYVTSFWSPSGDTFLIIPIPKKDKDFATIKHFSDNASEYHQKLFWKRAACEITRLLKIYDKLYVSTHGLGVSFFHLRISPTPKYYSTNDLNKLR